MPSRAASAGARRAASGSATRGRKLRRLYPAAVNRGDGARRRGYRLVTRRSSVGAGGTYPGLLAVMRDGRVRAFVVRYPAGGD